MTTEDDLRLEIAQLKRLRDDLQRNGSVLLFRARAAEKAANLMHFLLDSRKGKPIPMMPQPLEFSYTNYRGELSRRRVLPAIIKWGATEYHPEEQWLMDAYDLDKEEPRTFAIKDCGFDLTAKATPADWFGALVTATQNPNRVDEWADANPVFPSKT